MGCIACGLTQPGHYCSACKPAEWYDERANLVEFLEYLDDRGELTVPLAINIVEKPHRFTIEYDQMRKAQADALLRGEAAV